jgi:hypothetical protein
VAEATVWSLRAYTNSRWNRWASFSVRNWISNPIPSRPTTVLNLIGSILFRSSQERTRP